VPFEMARSFPLCIDRELLKDASVSLTARVVYAQLAAYNRPRGQCNPSMVTLANDLGLTYQMVRDAVGQLRKKDWISTTLGSHSFTFTLKGPGCSTEQPQVVAQTNQGCSTDQPAPSVSYLSEVGVEERARAKRDGAGPPRKKTVRQQSLEAYYAQCGKAATA
jgi:hypothetical protein